MLWRSQTLERLKMHALFILTVNFFLAPIGLWIFFPRNHGFLAGMGAAFLHEPDTVCPYAQGSMRREAWMRGYESMKTRM